MLIEGSLRDNHVLRRTILISGRLDGVERVERGERLLQCEHLGPGADDR
ncbi:hypothetical protein [Actinomyces viscosus]|nr:hypothetical protein [Actinomyces viscosus]